MGLSSLLPSFSLSSQVSVLPAGLPPHSRPVPFPCSSETSPFSRARPSGSEPSSPSSCLSDARAHHPAHRESPKLCFETSRHRIPKGPVLSRVFPGHMALNFLPPLHATPLQDESMASRSARRRTFPVPHRDSRCMLARRGSDKVCVTDTGLALTLCAWSPSFVRHYSTG